ncbi:hypothetical protein Sjap_008325 [Stephania japonica]|uniref:Uncharacterized protein n=1 Tax=Stephania japonica TaxID=461633 RepID=A0AAP0JQ23_9MAGN
MEDERVGDDDVQRGEEMLRSSDYTNYTNDFIPKAPFGSKGEAVNWVQRSNQEFVIVTKNSDVGGW